MTLTVRPVTEAVGAEISGVDLRKLGDREFAAIERAWHAHSMILLRGQTLSDDDLLAFSRRFGELDPPPNQERGRISPPGYPDIYVVSNVLDKKGDPIGALGAGEPGCERRRARDHPAPHGRREWAGGGSPSSPGRCASPPSS